MTLEDRVAAHMAFVRAFCGGTVPCEPQRQCSCIWKRDYLLVLGRAIENDALERAAELMIQPHDKRAIRALKHRELA